MTAETTPADRDSPAPVGSPERASVVLVVDDDETIRDIVRFGLEQVGHRVLESEDGLEALEVVRHEPVDLVVSDIQMPRCDGFELVRALRADERTRALPVVLMTALTEPTHAVTGLRLGADDYVRKPFVLDELVARVQVRLDRPPLEAPGALRASGTGLLTERALRADADRELLRSRQSGRPVHLACMRVPEADAVAERFGRSSAPDLVALVAATAQRHLGPLDRLAVARVAGEWSVLVLLPDAEPEEVGPRLSAACVELAGTPFLVHDETVHVSPSTGWTRSGDVTAGTDTASAVDELVRRAAAAATVSEGHFDLVPHEWTPELDARPEAPRRRRWSAAARTTQLQVLLTYVLGFVVPYLSYAALDRLGLDITGIVYMVIVVSLLVTAGSIWWEGLLALRPTRPPERPDASDASEASDASGRRVEAPTDRPRPALSAIIAAYLPNEAATVVDTVETFLATRYDGPVQVLLAYNTPTPLPVEDRLAEIARRDSRFVPYRVDGSTSKAQNVNAALGLVTGEVTGVFDADHHPDPDAFDRAVRWLEGGYDVVQGHCVVRNGDASLVARTVAVEFEAIYAVSHPGRARLHGFGIFGGSNGYWRTSALREARMQGRMLTEDIDSSIRGLLAGRRIASDPGLVSRELAPTTLQALWHQRMRWAQGWFQVSRRHLRKAWRSNALSVRQKAGLTFLLGWREVYPWISVQMFPLITYLAVRAGGADRLDWVIPLFVLTTAFTLSVGPGQVLFARRLAAPEIRARRWWFLSYLLVSSLAYTELKNVIARVAQVKELSGERRWVVTPRSADAEGQS